MNDDEFVEFLKSVLIKLENAINLVEYKQPRHIPSYNKVLGIQQKMVNIKKPYKDMLFSQLITVRSIIYYFMDGRYHEAYKQLLKLRSELVKIGEDIQKKDKNERDTV